MFQGLSEGNRERIRPALAPFPELGEEGERIQAPLWWLGVFCSAIRSSPGNVKHGRRRARPKFRGPITSQSDLHRLINASSATTGTQYGDKWNDIVEHLKIPNLTSERARTIWVSLKDEYNDLRDAPDLATTRDLICGGAFVFKPEECPGCGKTALSDARTAKLRKLRSGGQCNAYLDNGTTLNGRFYVRNCQPCEAEVFPFHWVPKGDAKSKLPIPSHLACSSLFPTPSRPWCPERYWSGTTCSLHCRVPWGSARVAKCARE